MLCNSGTDYSDDEDEEEDEDEAHDSDDADSICSGSTLSADGQDSMSSELVDSQFEEMYSEGRFNKVMKLCMADLFSNLRLSIRMHCSSFQALQPNLAHVYTGKPASGEAVTSMRWHK